MNNLCKDNNDINQTSDSFITLPVELWLCCKMKDANTVRFQVLSTPVSKILDHTNRLCYLFCID